MTREHWTSRARRHRSGHDADTLPPSTRSLGPRPTDTYGGDGEGDDPLLDRAGDPHHQQRREGGTHGD